LISSFGGLIKVLEIYIKEGFRPSGKQINLRTYTEIHREDTEIHRENIENHRRHRDPQRRHRDPQI